MSLVLAIANEKGGVGKTTTALSLGAALVELGQRVLLVDLDPQANLTLGIGIRPGATEGSIADVLLGDAALEDVAIETDVAGLKLAPSSDALLQAERFLPVRQDYELILRDALGRAGNPDAVIFDCPPALGALTRSALGAADLLVIPTQCEFFSAFALRQVIGLVRSVRERSNPALRYRLLLTMVDLRNAMHRSLAEEIRLAFGPAVFRSAIEVDARLRESPAFGQPITEYAPSSRGAQQYRELAQELREDVQETLAQVA
ncbi:MAG TPA: ParA family protein [Anaerolineales bacterium]|nr:ParA family protein [Anaerolineales bacterium]